ncbi:response regulator transcription factor [Fluviicola sp.]|uniref:LytR/AlgR family response regulator transcription factor n=1 Tax=Fluviicola sp. TaxID=1917219 RepID=UPI0031D39457
MKILIVEDEPFAAEELQEKLEKLEKPVVEVTGIAESYEEALELIRRNKPQLVLVDIELKGELTGIDLSEELQKQGIPFLYLTGLEELDVYYKAEKTGSLKFLSKPIDRYNLRNALLEAEKAITDEKKETLRFFTVKAGIRKSLHPDQVAYLKGGRSYCEIHFMDRSKWDISLNLGKVAEQIDHPDFIRIHKSFFVNKKHIEHIAANSVRLTTGIDLNISLTYKREVKRMTERP